MRAIKDLILLLRAKRKTEHRSIVIPDAAQKESWYGRAFAVGPKVEEVAEGDILMFDPGLSTPVLADQADTALCVAIREEAVLSVLTPEELLRLGFSDEFDDPFSVLELKVAAAK